MNKKRLYSSFLFLLLSASFAYAEQAVPQQVAAVQQAIQSGQHPFFDKSMYPD